MHRGYQPPSSSAADVPVLIDLIIQGPLYEDLMNPACRLTLVGEEFNGVPCWRGMNRLNSSNPLRHGKVVWLYRDTRGVWQITVGAADAVPPVGWPDAMLKNSKVTPIYTQPLKLIYPNSTLATLASLAQQWAYWSATPTRHRGARAAHAGTVLGRPHVLAAVGVLAREHAADDAGPALPPGRCRRRQWRG